MRNSIDDLSKRVRGLEKLETRIAELERRVDELSGTKTAAKQTEPKPPATTS
jgi:phage shock protein A